jgi:hypothetical protein
VDDLKQPGSIRTLPTGQEMTLKQWVERLPEGHKARKQFQTLITALEIVRDAQVWHAMRDECDTFGIDAHYVQEAREALKEIRK